MKQRFLAAGILVVVGASSWNPLLACGDKFLLPGRGLSFEQAYRATHPGSVLIYAPAGSGAATKGYANLQTMLTRAGHRVSIAQNVAQFKQALAAAIKVDIVLTDLSEAPALGPQAATTSVAPLILPVMDRATKAETAACKLLYPCQLKSSDKPEHFLTTINSAMNDRAKVLALKAQHGNN